MQQLTAMCDAYHVAGRRIPQRKPRASDPFPFSPCLHRDVPSTSGGFRALMRLQYLPLIINRASYDDWKHGGVVQATEPSLLTPLEDANATAVSEKHGTRYDQRDMDRMGKLQQLRVGTIKPVSGENYETD